MPARIAVVTGASSGIGRAIAVRIARERFEPLLLARRPDKLAETKAAVAAAGGTAHVHALDVTKSGAADDALAAAKRLGDVEAVINNAGFATYGEFAMQDRAANARMLDTNVRALTDFTAAFLAHFVEKKHGYVMNVASTAGYQPLPYNAAYAATKAYVLSFGEAVAAELRGSGVSLTTLCPGATQSEFWEVGRYAEQGLVVPASILMSAERVADIGVRGMLKRKTTVIAGLSNRAIASAGRHAPRGLVTRIAAAVTRPRKSR